MKYVINGECNIVSCESTSHMMTSKLKMIYIPVSRSFVW